MSESENNVTEQDKTAALHDIANEVEREREERGHSALDGQPVVSNEPDASEGDESATLVDGVQSIPPVRPFGN